MSATRTWLRAGEAAAVLGVSVATFLRLCRAGKIRCARSPGGHYQPTLADLARYLDSLIATAA